MAKTTKKSVKTQAPILSLEELKKQKIDAGLTPAQAESVAKRQLARDEELADSDEPEENPPKA
jgi:hypothetical protein